MCPPGSFSLSPDSGCIFPYYLPDDDARLETQNKSAQEYCDSLSSHIPIINTPEDANNMIRELRSLMVRSFQKISKFLSKHLPFILRVFQYFSLLSSFSIFRDLTTKRI